MVTALLLNSITASASEQLYNKTIQKIHTYKDMAVVLIAEPGNNVDQCTNTYANKSIAIQYANGGDKLFSAVLAAQMAKKSVSFGVSGCVNWNGTIPNAYRVDVAD